ncbi:MAG: hypothetical protein MUF58_22465 [Arcicella sp.]|jgi:hypothetical protein|nr:hypothetical protein [Arcicella sp.]
MAKKDFKNSINQTNIPAKSGIKGLFSPTGNSEKEEIVTSKIPVTLSENQNLEVRQTFIVKNTHLEKLKDFVHYKRQQGYSFYTQKEGLNEAFEVFFASLNEIPNRPDFIKDAEVQRASRIKKSL